MDLRKEKQLIGLVQQGDMNAYGELILKYQHLLYKRAFSILGNQEASQDALQSCFLRSHRFIKKFRGESSIYTWWYRILSNECYDYIRKKTKQKEIPIDGTLENLAVLIDDKINLQKNIEHSDDSRYLIEKINLLAKKYRKVILYRYYEDMSYSQIAELICSTEGTVKSRLFKAKELLQREIIKDKREGMLFD